MGAVLRLKKVRVGGMCRPSSECEGMVPSLAAGAGACVPLSPGGGAGRRNGAGGGTRTLTSVKLNGFSYRLRLSPSGRGVLERHVWFAVWTIPSPSPGRSGLRCCPSSLYTFPAGTFRPGLARDCHVTGFPEFGQFCIAGFQASTQVSLSPLRLPVPPRPHGWLRIFVYHKAAARTGQFGFKVSAGFSSLLTWVS